MVRIIALQTVLHKKLGHCNPATVIRMLFQCLEERHRYSCRNSNRMRTTKNHQIISPSEFLAYASSCCRSYVFTMSRASCFSFSSTSSESPTSSYEENLLISHRDEFVNRLTRTPRRFSMEASSRRLLSGIIM